MRKVIVIIKGYFMHSANTRAVLAIITFFLFISSAKSQPKTIDSRSDSKFEEIEPRQFAIYSIVSFEVGKLKDRQVVEKPQENSLIPRAKSVVNIEISLIRKQTKYCKTLNMERRVSGKNIFKTFFPQGIFISPS